MENRGQSSSIIFSNITAQIREATETIATFNTTASNLVYSYSFNAANFSIICEPNNRETLDVCVEDLPDEDF